MAVRKKGIGKGLRDRDIAWEAQKGSQELFLQADIFEMLASGNRGGGKSEVILVDFLQHVGVGWGIDWRGILFRETYAQLDDVIKKTKKLFPKVFPSARFNINSHTWIFPDGEQLLLRHMKSPSDYDSYHGHEYCVEVGTLVKTPTGYTPIEHLKVGDEVITVDGVDHVSRTFIPSIKNCVVASFYDDHQNLVCEQVQSEEHRLLTIGSDRHTPSSSSYHTPSQYPQSGSSWLSYTHLFGARPRSHIHEGHEEIYGGSLSRGGRQIRQALSQFWQQLCASLPLSGLSDLLAVSHQRSAIECYCACIPNVSKFGSMVSRSSFDQGLPRLSESSRLFSDYDASSAPAYERLGKRELQDSGYGYHPGDRSYDGQSPHLLSTGQGVSPSPSGDGVRALGGLLLDDRDQAHKHIRPYGSISFPNPYEKNSCVRSDQVGVSRVEMVPCGPRLTVDISVKRNKMYITKGGVVNSNCWIGWEELTNWATPDCYTLMQSCCRSSVNPAKRDVYGRPMVRKYRSSTNSYGKGFNWIKKRFQLPQMMGQVIREEEQTPEGLKIMRPRLAMNFSFEENIALRTAEPDYMDVISQAARNPAERAAWLYGSWDITSGGMFDDLWRPHQHIVEPFGIPDSWYIDRSFDWGSSKPAAVCWWAESDGCDITMPDGSTRATLRGDLFLIAEWYISGRRTNEGARMSAADMAKGIVLRELSMKLRGRVFGKDRVRPGCADSSIWDADSGPSIASQMQKPVLLDGVIYPGVYWEKANKSPGTRKIGAQLLRERLENSSRYPRERPGIFIFSTCKKWIELVPILPRDEKDPDDVDTDVDDHEYDSTRYRLTAQKNLVGFGRSVGTT